ncbi:MAG: chemotaxis family two-component system response regulator Rcp1 [Gammaproteobacteria bacterium]|jgi:chemotaxis family two-component system response regulator Rcp1
MTKLFNGVAAEILLVEDNPGDARLTAEAFRDAKISNNLRHVSDGVEAMAYLRQQSPYAQALRPDLILLDLNMPRMNGSEVLEAIKDDPQLKSIPVIVLTTSVAEQDIARSYMLQANCFISKPVDFDAFLKMMRDIENFWLTPVKLPEDPAVAV